jgi:two-component system, OmpR family, response regulator
MKTTSSMTILIADDDIDILSQLSAQVQNMGFQVITAESQKEAEKTIQKIKPDLAIFDLMMDNRDSGFILSYMLRKKHPDVPIIIATAVTADTGIVFELDTPEQKSWIKADRYLEKGLRPEQLEMEIKQLLKM